MTYDVTATHRVQRATFAILIIGAIAGAILGAGLLGVVGLLADGPGGYPYLWDAFTLAGSVGGVLGGLSLAFVASTVLSHVAIGRILIYAAVGTVVGTLAASIVSPFDSVLSTLGAVVGFIAAMMLLKRISKTMRP
jgi:hypothetical protein